MSRALILVALLTTAVACTRHHDATTPPASSTPAPPPSGGGAGAATSTTTTPPDQTPPYASGDVQCPAIQMKAPDSVSQGTKARVFAVIVGGNQQPTYKWSLTNGSIASGQGSLSIFVDTAGLSGSGVTATLALGGLPRQCAATTASVTFLVGP